MPHSSAVVWRELWHDFLPLLNWAVENTTCTVHSLILTAMNLETWRRTLNCYRHQNSHTHRHKKQTWRVLGTILLRPEIQQSNFECHTLRCMTRDMYPAHENLSEQYKSWIRKAFYSFLCFAAPTVASQPHVTSSHCNIKILRLPVCLRHWSNQPAQRNFTSKLVTFNSHYLSFLNVSEICSGFWATLKQG